MTFDADSWAETLEHARTPREVRAVVAALRHEIAYQPLPHQRTPEDLDWFLWLLLGGRGSGKTQAACGDFDEHMMGPPCDPRVPGGHRGLIVAPTLGDGKASCIDGPSGLRVLNPRIETHTSVGGTFIRWPNGAVADLRGAYTPENIERLRAAGNRCRVWAEEFAAWRYLGPAFDHLLLGTRLGARPRIVASTTPKPRPTIKRLVQAAERWAHGDEPEILQDRVVLARASINDNPFLPPDVRAGLLRRYAGTRLGGQELEGLLLDDYEGALFRREWIDQDRVATVDRRRLVRVMVGIDPSTWHPDLGEDPDTEGIGIETGIIVAGIDDEREVYVVEDASGRFRPEEWARIAADAYHRWESNAVVPEVNLGGMVLSTIHLVDPSVAIYREGKRVGVRAKVGKRARAEPVAALYEQHRVHHVGSHELLEDQLCGWDPQENWSPDRLDALVHVITALAPWAPSGAGTALSTTGRVRR